VLTYTFSSVESMPSATSSIRFTATDARGNHEGELGSFRGIIAVANGDPNQSSITVEMDLSSLRTDDAKLTNALKSRDFLDVARYPRARFSSESIANSGELGATNTVAGTLELHGVRLSITIPATVHVHPEGVDVDAELTLHPKDFALTFPGKRNAPVENDIVLMLLVTALRASEASSELLRP
jgi:polyisoprenoid-binding protein YceI